MVDSSKPVAAICGAGNIVAGADLAIAMLRMLAILSL